MSSQAAAVIITAILGLVAIIWVAAWSAVRQAEARSRTDAERHGYEVATAEMEMRRAELEARIEQSKYDRP
jgi:C4-dicarboxylate-specific signal transduction histidine kinase